MRTVVAVLRGGANTEYDVSLKTGGAVLEALDREKYDPRDIFIDQNGQWHSHGIPMPPERVLRGVDVAFNALHHGHGENAEVLHILERLGVRHTGSSRVAAALAANKEHMRALAEHHGVLVPRGIVVPRGVDIEEEALRIFRTFPHPAIVKPVVGSSSRGTTLADSFHALVHGLKHALGLAPKAVVEEYIRGKEATVGVLDNFRGEQHYALLPVEIRLPVGSRFYDYDTKYGKDTSEVCPGAFSDDEKQALASAARTMHRESELSHYSRSDFIVSKRGVYYLETNFEPELMKGGLMELGLQSVGSSLPHFVGHVVRLAEQR